VPAKGEILDDVAPRRQTARHDMSGFDPREIGFLDLQRECPAQFRFNLALGIVDCASVGCGNAAIRKAKIHPDAYRTDRIDEIAPIVAGIVGRRRFGRNAGRERQRQNRCDKMKETQHANPHSR
jgi:hypothetical protein